eukprot:CAMPEP_0116871184 /NCGR_PEP_ID=MMETSP0463-20121206/1420_1 /TAXON_ID=181622 /ORGANISM="Strombidinopsis sp, Strain SopsisLIS2011" /LENGTH=78 /DNA_ID=CAMNT_0004509123 /DNA_START=109 /DNA_END=345 /DNA_ORIENTATION=-
MNPRMPQGNSISKNVGAVNGTRRAATDHYHHKNTKQEINGLKTNDTNNYESTPINVINNSLNITIYNGGNGTSNGGAA